MGKMSHLVSIPKLLRARETLHYDQKIPKIIWQTMKKNQVPALMKEYVDSWIELNPEYEYRFHDDDDIAKFIQTDFPEFVEGYHKLKYGASKADLWRYLIIYKYGGVYADMDCKCFVPLRNWVNPNSSLVTQLGINKDICQWLIISEPGNLIFLKAAKRTIENAKGNNYKTNYKGFEYKNNELRIRENQALIKFNHGILGLSGPPVLQKCAEECYEEGLLDNLLKDIQVVCVSYGTSCQMKGNVAHDTRDEAYKKAYNSLNLSHYNDRLERLKRKVAGFLSFRNTN